MQMTSLCSVMRAATAMSGKLNNGDLPHVTNYRQAHGLEVSDNSAPKARVRGVSDISRLHETRRCLRNIGRVDHGVGTGQGQRRKGYADQEAVEAHGSQQKRNSYWNGSTHPSAGHRSRVHESPCPKPALPGPCREAMFLWNA